MVNTFAAHRLTHLAKAHGLGAEMHERLMRAQLCEGRVLDDPETLAELAAEVASRPTRRAACSPVTSTRGRSRRTSGRPGSSA